VCLTRNKLSIWSKYKSISDEQILRSLIRKFCSKSWDLLFSVVDEFCILPQFDYWLSVQHFCALLSKASNKMLLIFCPLQANFSSRVSFAHQQRSCKNKKSYEVSAYSGIKYASLSILGGYVSFAKHCWSWLCMILTRLVYLYFD